MSVEKIPNMAAHGASNPKNGANVKGGKGAHDAGDAEGAFGLLLSNLGGGDGEPVVETSAAPAASDNQQAGDTSTDGGALMAFTSVTQVAPLAVTAASVVDVGVANVHSEPSTAGEMPSAADIVLMTTDTRSRGVFPGIAQGSRSPGQIDWSQMPDAGESGSAASKTARLLKERGRSENVSAAMTELMRPANAIDASKMDIRSMSEKAEFRTAALVPSVAELLPLEVGSQTEFRREKAIFKMNSTTAGADANTANRLDAQPASFNLESLASDVGAGMAQGDQNPGSYWMSSDLRNAEIKLDGFGESSVEVSVSVHGNQTHVAFRTDDVQTRLAMEDANIALKDMLNKEGLDLAGVSVGTSGSGGDGAQDGRSRPDSRAARIGGLTGKFPSGVSSSIAPGRVGQLDVFV